MSKIFFDLDETLIYSEYSEFSGYNFAFTDTYGVEHFVAIRPEAQRTIDFTRQLVGFKNVFICTMGGWAYAPPLCYKANFRFHTDNIITHDEIYGERRDDFDNYLIDDTPPMSNDYKLLYLNINQTWHDRYLQVPKFFGEKDYGSFYEKVEKFLTKRILAI